MHYHGVRERDVEDALLKARRHRLHEGVPESPGPAHAASSGWSSFRRWLPSRVKSEKCSPSRRSEEPTSELQSLLRHSYAVFCLSQTRITTYRRVQTNNCACRFRALENPGMLCMHTSYITNPHDHTTIHLQ